MRLFIAASLIMLAACQNQQNVATNGQDRTAIKSSSGTGDDEAALSNWQDVNEKQRQKLH